MSLQWLRTAWMRIQALARRRQLDRDLEDELHFHLEMRKQQARGEGAVPEEAHYAARRRFGNLTSLKEACRDMWTLGWVESLWQDVCFGARMLRKNPGFTAVAVLTLALGIGANTAIFSVVNGVLLSPLAYRDPDRLVILYETSKELGTSSTSYPNFEDWRRDTHSFEAMAAFRNQDYNLTGTGGPEYVYGKMVSADFFSVLGVAPVTGRFFSAQEDQLGSAPVAMISASLWRQRFSSDPGVVGRTLALNGTDYTIVGVVPAGFRLWSRADVFTLIGQWRSKPAQNRGLRPGIHAVARLKPGVSVAQADAEMQAIGNQLAKAYPDANTGHGATARALKQDMVGEARPTLILLWAAVGFLLLVACANVASLLLSRSTTRLRELAVRTALGAGRTRILRQLLTESVLLALLGGGLGLGLAAAGMKPLLRAIPGSLPRAESIGINLPVLLFTLAAALFTGIVFGLVPALQVRRGDVQHALKEGGRSVAGGRHRVQSALVIFEVAASLLLLAAAGLMVRTIRGLWQVNPGFDPRNVLTMQVALSPRVAGDPTKIRSALDQLLDRVRTLPGIESAAITALIPLSGDDNELPFWVGNGPMPPPSKLPQALAYITSPGYLRAMRIPQLQGRFFTEQDNLHARQVVVIDEVLAHRYYPGENPLGRVMKLPFLGSAEIIGVVGHVKHWGLDSDDTSNIRDQFYYPVAQVPDVFMPQASAGLTIVLRTRSSPVSAATAVGSQVMGPGRDQPVYNVQTMEQIIGDSLARRRFSMFLLGIFALVAASLAAVGIYGVIAYSVSQRTHEIGIRMALGAERRDVLRLVVGQGMKLTLVGVGIGILGALALTRLMSSLLYGVTATDPLTFTAVALLMTLVALLACWIPARRAMRVDPLVALRYE